MINNPAGEILIFKQAKQLKKLDRALLAKTKAQDVPAELKRLQAQSPKKKKDAFPVKSFEPARPSSAFLAASCEDVQLTPA